MPFIIFHLRGWQKAYGGNQGDYGQSIYRTSEGGYIVAGSTLSFGAGNSDGWVLKLDANGNIQWQKAYGGANWDWLYAIRQTLDGGYLTAGQTSSFGAGGFDVWVSRMEKDGNMGNCSAAGNSAATVTDTTAIQTNITEAGQDSAISPQTTNAPEKESKATQKVVCGIPDLTGSWTTLEQICNSTPKGQKCKISGTFFIENIGHWAAPSCSVQFYLSDDENYDDGVDTLLKKVSTGIIKAGASSTKKMSYSLATGVTATGKYIIAVIDADHAAVEEDEANNAIPWGPIP
jgi:hypothetical protein